jgi:Sulfotransferase family
MTPTSFPDCSPIFVVGSGRSGTTLLQAMLNAHPAISIAGELHFFDLILLLKRTLPDLSDPKQADQLFELLPTLSPLQPLSDFGRVLARVRERFQTTHPSYELLYRFTLEAFAEEQGASRPGEKTPANMRYLEQLVSLFPTCRIIHIVRDPRAVVASKLKLSWSSHDVLSHALRWKAEVGCARTFVMRREFSSNCLFEIKYEDLIMKPEHTARQLCQFVGEAYNESMLNYYLSSHKLMEKEPWKSGVTRPFYKSSLNSWQDELRGSRLFLVERIAGIEMQHYDYKKSRPSAMAVVGSPFAFFSETLRWLSYKWQERRQRMKQPEPVYGNNKRLLQILLRLAVR